MEEALYPTLYDALRAHGHRLALRLVADPVLGTERAWISGAGFGALGHSIEHAARLYAQAGASMAGDPQLRATLMALLHDEGWSDGFQAAA
jgi:hypothetical protein